MADVRLTINLPEEWLEILQRVALRNKCRSVGEYVRQMIVENPSIAEEAKATADLPPMKKKWGGRQKREN